MSTLPTFRLLDVNLSHLSLNTEKWMRGADARKEFGILERDTGFIVNSMYGEDGVWESEEHLPGDLLHVLRFAAANGREYVMFDADGAELDELPKYDDSNAPTHLPEGYDASWVAEANGLSGVWAIDPCHIPFKDLKIEEDNQGNTVPLLSGSYTAPEDGGTVWIEVGSAAVSILQTEEMEKPVGVHGEAGVLIKVYATAPEEAKNDWDYGDKTLVAEAFISEEEVKDLQKEMLDKINENDGPL